MDRKRKTASFTQSNSPPKRFKYDHKQDPLPTFEERIKAKESNPNRLRARQNQIEKGYNTEGYRRYTEAVPKDERQKGNDLHPVTPDIHQTCSKRSFDGQVRSFRQFTYARCASGGVCCINGTPLLHRER
jgi:hypothetical protein